MMWTKYSEQRPPAVGNYWWRLPVNIDGTIYFAEWIDEYYKYTCNDSYAPTYKYWDGYQTHTPAKLEWRPLEATEVAHKEPGRTTKWPGLELKPCPFCGRQPYLNFGASRGYHWACDFYGIECCIVNVGRKGQFKEAIAYWNKRHEVVHG